MALTVEQLATLKAAILAETDPAFVAARSNGATGTMAEFYRQPSAFVVWRNTTPVAEIQDAISWANMTPVDAPDGSEIGRHRELRCQGKQFNLSNLIIGREQLNTGKQNIRAGLQDALTNIPSGAGGNNLSANWVAVRTVIQRNANRGEALFATGTGTAATPGVLVFEGAISSDNIATALSD